MGGSPQVAYQLSRHLSERGHEVTVVTSNYALQHARFPEGPFQVTHFPCHSFLARWGYYATPGLIPWARTSLTRRTPQTVVHPDCFDIIHLHEVRTFQNTVVRHFAVRRGVPYVLSAHGTLPIIVQRHAAKRAYDQLFGRRLLRSAARLVAVSPVEVEQYVQAGVEQERICVIYNGLDLAEFSHLPPWGRFRERLGIPKETKAILFLGRLHRRKRVDHLIDAFARLSACLDSAVEKSAVRLVIAGPDEGQQALLEAQARYLGVHRDVLFAGPLYGEDRLTAFVDADVLASPGVYEIFGLVPFEALMCGTPVVVAEDCGLGRLIAEAGAGYTVPAGDVSALANALARALTHHEEVHAAVHAGQAFVREQLDWRASVSALEALYAEVARGG
jgi:glycosyltransferase involved in cell wall biosynthesis